MAAHQAPLSLGFSRQEHWSGLPFPSPIHESEKSKWSRSVMSDSLWPHRLQPTRLLNPWNFPARVLEWGAIAFSDDQPRQHTKKQRHYFAHKDPSSQSYGFSSSHVWMWESVKKDECWRIDAFELWCWRRLLRIPWTARRSNQSILKDISPECSLEGLMLKLKLQYFGHLMLRTDSFEKILMLIKIEDERRGQQRMRRLDGSPIRWTWVWVSSGSWWWTGRPGVLRFMGLQRVGKDWVT